MNPALCSLFSLLSVASAHFSIKYPVSRGNTDETQNQYPCGGGGGRLDGSTSDRTAWPFTGGSLVLETEHPFAYTSVNLGLGSGIDAGADFPITLVPEFNQTGAGVFCLEKITIPKSVDVGEDMNATVQVVQMTDAGYALYDCADIRFRSNTVLLQNGDCVNSTGVAATAILPGSPSGKGGSKANGGVGRLVGSKGGPRLLLGAAAAAAAAIIMVVPDH